jgi:hypothetical protein
MVQMPAQELEALAGVERTRDDMRCDDLFEIHG